jgi:hypothetical protein
MPAKPVQFRERSYRRIIRAARKEGALSVTITTPGETITFSLAEQPDREVSLDLNIDELTKAKSEWDKDYGKDAP